MVRTLEIEAVRREKPLDDTGIVAPSDASARAPERRSETGRVTEFDDRGLLRASARGAQLVRSCVKIDQRLAELAEKCSPGAIDQQAFCEECQLLIAKYAFEAQPQAMWLNVAWLGKTATAIAAVLNRRLKGAHDEMRRKLATELRASIMNELQELKTRVLDYERRTTAAENARDALNARSEEVERSNANLLVQVRDQASQMQDLRKELAALKKECERCRENEEEALNQKQDCDRYAGALANSLEEMREKARYCEGQIEVIQQQKSDLQTRLTAMEDEVTSLQKSLSDERRMNKETLQELRASYAQKAQDLSASIENEKSLVKQEVLAMHHRVSAAQETEKKMARMEHANDQLERELRATRECITELLDATARIGHFSARLSMTSGSPSGSSRGGKGGGGGGRRDYESVGKAWEKLHKFLSRSVPIPAAFSGGYDMADEAMLPDGTRGGFDEGEFRKEPPRGDSGGSGASKAILLGGKPDSFRTQDDMTAGVRSLCEAEGRCSKSHGSRHSQSECQSPQGSVGEDKHRHTYTQARASSTSGAGRSRTGTGVVSERLRESMQQLTVRQVRPGDGPINAGRRSFA